jgi:hypothetical protein
LLKNRAVIAERVQVIGLGDDLNGFPLHAILLKLCRRDPATTIVARVAPRSKSDTCGTTGGAHLHNFVRIRQMLRATTPAMAAGASKRLWEIGDVVDEFEAWEARVSKKGRPALTTRALYRLADRS